MSRNYTSTPTHIEEDDLPYEFVQEALDLLEELSSYTNDLNSREMDFVVDVTSKLEGYGFKTYISESQIKWLRDIYKKYCETYTS